MNERTLFKKSMGNFYPTFLQAFILIVLFGVIFLVYFFSPVITSFDSRWSILTAMSILEEGNTDLNEYKEILQREDFYSIETINGNYYSVFPVGAPIIAVPFVFAFDKAFELIIDKLPFVENYIKNRVTRYGEKDVNINLLELRIGVELFVASFLSALTAVFIYLIATIFVTRYYSLIIVCIFSFCTPAWSTASRALWQHAPSMLMLSIALYLLLLAKRTPKLIQYVSVPLAFSLVIRPTNAIPLIGLTIFVFVNYRRYFFRYIFWALPIATAFFTYNVLVYQSLFSSYANPGRLFSNPDFFQALAGNLISPSRGLFIFSPVLLFPLCFFRIKNLQVKNLDSYLIIIILMHWIVISSFSHWWAGHSFGPRFFCDIIPFLMYFLILYFKKFAEYSGIHKLIMGAAITVTIAISFFIHYQGANTRAVYEWNVKPVNVDIQPGRLWDWKDIQFLRGMGTK